MLIGDQKRKFEGPIGRPLRVGGVNLLFQDDIGPVGGEKGCKGSRRRLAFALLGVSMLCAIPASHAAAAYQANIANNYAVVLFIPFNDNDLGFSEAVYRGYLALQHSGYRIDVVRNVARMSEKQILAIIDQRHAAGVRGFVLAGAELSAATAAAAIRYPDACFATMSGTARGANIVNYCLDSRALGGVLAGQIAAGASKTKIVGFVGGVESVDGGEAESFKRSVHIAAPDATVLIDWTGDWDDRKLAACLAQRQIRAGADIVVAAANDAVIAAVSQHRQVRAIGWMVDASSRYHNVAASVVIDTGIIFRRFVGEAAAGHFAGGEYAVTESDNVWKVIWAPGSSRHVARSSAA
jgi:basic membrane protein A